MENIRFAEIVAEVEQVLAQHPEKNVVELVEALNEQTAMEYEEELMAEVYERVGEAGYYLEPSVQQYSGTVSVYELDDGGDPMGSGFGEYDWAYETVCMLELIAESDPDLGPEDFYNRAVDFLVGMCKDLAYCA